MDVGQTPLISVVVRTHNRADSLHLALKCLVNQTYRPIEIIVIDHNSIDNTHEVSTSFGDVVRYFKHTGSFRDTFNVWRGKVRGSYISFLDDDDYILPSCFEKLANVLITRKEIDVVFPRHRFYTESGKQCVIIEDTRRIDYKKIKKLILRRNVVPWNGVLLRKYCLSSVPFFDEGIVGGFDWFFFLHIAAAGFNFYHFDEVLGVIKRSHDSVQLEIERMSKGGLQCVQFYARHMNINDKIAYDYYYVYGSRLIRHGMILLDNGDVKNGRIFLLKGIFYFMFCREERIKFIYTILVFLLTFISDPMTSRMRIEKSFSTFLFRNYFEINQLKKSDQLEPNAFSP
jgi:glycosyltransferase involved in cell wall biosynthesis